MSSHNRNSNVENARRFLWDSSDKKKGSSGTAAAAAAANSSSSNTSTSEIDASGTHNRRTIQRGGAGFSTRDFNVVDQSVNLMDMESDNNNNNNNSHKQKQKHHQQQQQPFGGLFRAKMESENLNKFTDEYGDADTMNQEDAEEYIYKRRRRLSSLLAFHNYNSRLRMPSVSNLWQKRPGSKVLLTIAVAFVATLLVFSSIHSLVEEELEENRETNIDNNSINNNSINNNIDQSSGSGNYVLGNQKAEEGNHLEEHAIQQRYSKIKERIIESGVSPEAVFDHKSSSSSSSSPQEKALDWLVLEDPAFLSWDHDSLLDRYGLAVLYFCSNSNSPWKESDHWMSGTGICNWHGIQCLPREQKANSENNYEPFTYTYDQDNSVVAILLPGNQLGGTIPDELGTAFPELLTIDLGGNGLTGTLPGALSKNPLLKDLLVSDNGLTGTLPQVYVLLKNLHRFDVSHNQLSGEIWSDWRSSLTRLRYFAASHNQLEGPFPDMSKMTRLTGLVLEGNNMAGPLPESLGGMTSLLDLRIGDNKFSGPITGLKALTNLETMHLSNNEFTGTIPDMFDLLFRLHEIVMPNNKFEGSIPRTLTHLQSLKTLDLDSNQLDGELPPGLGILTDVITISLKDNRFEGPIPTILGKLDDIKTLNLQGNELSGPIPTELGLCFRLTTLNLQGNKLTGAIPEELGDLMGLANLKLEDNGFEGVDMPPQVCALRDDGDLMVLTSDCKSTKKVACVCCTKCL